MTPDELERARAAATRMTDRELLDLHRHGRDAFGPGAWQVLDDEGRSRDRPRRAWEGLRRPTQADRPSSRLKAHVNGIAAAGVVVLVLGVIGMLWALNLDVSVSTPFGQQVVNLSLMDQKRSYLLVAGVVALIGAVLLGAGLLRRE